MTIYWIDYGFGTMGGHSYSAAHAMRVASNAAGIGFEVHAPAILDAGIAASVGAERELSHSIYRHPYGKMATPEIFNASLNERRKATAADLARLLSEKITGADTVVLVTPMAPELAGFADWVEQLDPAARPRLAAYCILPVEFRLAVDLTWQRSAMMQQYSAALGRLHVVSDSCFLLLCENETVYEALSPFVTNSHLQRHLFTIPGHLSQSRSPPSIPTILSIGAVRREKGTDLTRIAMEQLRARRPLCSRLQQRISSF
jgi:hypothetical protein